jgi:hypothetical protein
MTELGKRLLRDKDHAAEGLQMLELGAAGGDPEAHRALFQFHSSGTASNMSKALVRSLLCVLLSGTLGRFEMLRVAGALGAGCHQRGAVHTR